MRCSASVHLLLEQLKRGSAARQCQRDMCSSPSRSHRSPRSHHNLYTRTGSHVRIRTYNPAWPSLRQP